jgi:hypothetical protein
MAASVADPRSDEWNPAETDLKSLVCRKPDYKISRLSLRVMGATLLVATLAQSLPRWI